MTTDIYRLIDNYFEGKTSAEEEKILRDYFAQDDLPEELKEYAPIFNFFNDEADALAVLNEIRNENNGKTSRQNKTPLRKLWTIAAVAACLLITVLLIIPNTRPSALVESYVWVDGKRITDPIIVQKYAESSFANVQTENNILEQQLGFMLE